MKSRITLRMGNILDALTAPAHAHTHNHTSTHITLCLSATVHVILSSLPSSLNITSVLPKFHIQACLIKTHIHTFAHMQVQYIRTYTHIQLLSTETCKVLTMKWTQTCQTALPLSTSLSLLLLFPATQCSHFCPFYPTISLQNLSVTLSLYCFYRYFSEDAFILCPISISALSLCPVSVHQSAVCFIS